MTTPREEIEREIGIGGNVIYSTARIYIGDAAERVIAAADAREDALREEVAQVNHLYMQALTRLGGMEDLRAQLAAANEERERLLAKVTSLNRQFTSQLNNGNTLARALAAEKANDELNAAVMKEAVRTDAAEQKAANAAESLRVALLERDCYREVLIGAEYERVRELPAKGIEFCQAVGKRAKERAVEINDERDTLQERVEELEKKLRDVKFTFIDPEQREYRERLDRMVAAYISDNDQWSGTSAANLREMIRQCVGILATVDAHCAEKAGK